MKVKITYCPDLHQIGKVKDLPVDEARDLIRTSRAIPFEHHADTQPETVDALVRAHSKDELLELAESRGLETDPQATKAHIAAQVIADATS